MEEIKKQAIMVEVYPDGSAVIPYLEKDGQRLTFYSKDGIPFEQAIKSFQNYIPRPPAAQDALYSKACSNDGVTIKSWAEQWINQCKLNFEKYGFNADNSVATLYGKEDLKPIILAGSGPSLKKNIMHLKPQPVKRNYPEGEKWETIGGRGEIRIVSCVHNFSYFEDNDIMTENDYYVNLDAGEITIKEIWEGGQHEPDWYWERSKGRTLVAFTSSHPDLLRQWKGKILWFTTAPNPATTKEISKYVDTSVIPAFNTGGNVLGAALYLTKAILGGSTMIFIGADFAFDRTHKFHGWDSQYDNMFKGVESAVDVFGDRVYTWPSYFNFKCWFDFMACGGQGNHPQLWINCTEGGLLGAYPEGNIQQIIQMSLKDCLSIFNLHRDFKTCLEKSKEIVKILM